MTDKTCRQLAEDHYDKAGQNFQLALEWHDDNGWVINVPYAFGMGYFYEDEGQMVLFITYTIGDMSWLSLFRRNIIIDKIEFKRNFKGQVRRYDFNNFISRIK